MPNIFKSEGHTVDEVAASAIPAGQFAFENAIAKFYSGGDAVTAGQPVAAYVGGVTIQVLKAVKANTYSVGADVFGDETAQTALTAGGDGKLGICAKASTANDDHVDVRMIN